MMRASLMTAVLMMAAGSALAVDTPEVEPNETKASATVVNGMQPDVDTLTGDCTGVATVAGPTSLDTWDITTTAAPTPGIYEYRLEINETGTTGRTLSIRGLTQTAGVIAAGTDTPIQTAAPTTAHFVKWFANEQPSRIYLRLTGTSSTTTPYVLTLRRFPATPAVVPAAVEAGPVFISTMGQTTVNTDLWLYDSSLNAIVDAGNDNNSVAGGGTGSGTQSRLQRNLAAGTYIMAISTANMVNHMAAPLDETTRNNTVADFPNAICTATPTAGTTDLDFEIGNRCVGSSQIVTNTAQFMEVKFVSFTVSGTQVADPLALTAGSASPAGVGAGGSTLLTVTAAGQVPTAVTGDLTQFGLTATEAFHDDGVNGDVAAGDNIWSYTLTTPAGQSLGAYSITVTATPSSMCVNGSPTRQITLNVTPSNNLCSSAVPIQIGGSYPGTTIGALGAGGLLAGCNTISGTNPGVWYVFTETSPVGRRLVASVCDPVTNFDAQMVLYTGSCGAFTCVWGNDVSGFGCPIQNPALDTGPGAHTNTPVIINWTAGTPGYKCTVPGQTYYIGVLNRTAANGGNFVLHLDEMGEPCQGIAPDNDTCAAPRPLTAFPTWDVVIRDTATPDADVSCNAAANTGSRGGIWYSFTPSQPGNLFHAKIPDQGTAGSTTDTVVTVFAGSDCGTLSEVACVDVVEGYVNRFTTPIAALNAGTAYYILVSHQSATAAIPGGENIGFDFVGTGPSCPGDECGSQDYNGDGDFGTDQDIEAFFACLGGNCCATCFCQGSDFNGDGDFGTDQDIEAFFRVLGGGSC